MNARGKILAAFAISAMTLAVTAHAHDPKEFDRMMAPVAKPVPGNCLQLADTPNYTADLGNADMKALKERCDQANKRAAAKAAARAKTSAAGTAKTAEQVKRQ